jgi:hypothetical protein
MTSSVGLVPLEGRKLRRVTWPLAVTVTGMTAALAGSWKLPEASVRTLPKEDSMTAPETGARLTVSTSRPLTAATPVVAVDEGPAGGGDDPSQPP